MKPLALALLVLAGCASSRELTRADSLEPTEARPVVACAYLCKGGVPMFFAQQHICSRGANLQFQDVQIIGTILDKWLTCGERDEKTHRCTLARELPKTDVELSSCTTVVSMRRSSQERMQRGKDTEEFVSHERPQDHR